MSRILVALCLVLVPVRAGADRDRPADLDGGTVPSPIMGGQEAAACAWPTAVGVLNGGSICTGTLVHPELVVYAAHCGGGSPRVVFGERSNAPAKQASVDFCLANPAYGGTQDEEHDWAFCKLGERVPMATTPPVFGCETEALTAGREVAIVGFGASTAEGTGASVKRWAMTTINSVQPSTLSIGGGGTGVCPGDSGGPAFVQFADGSWRAVGIASTVLGGCGGTGTHGRMDAAVAWIEENSGIDITPCHDADGTWNPTARCQRFAAGEPTGSGSWSDYCADTPVGPSNDSCGEPFDAVPDPDPPTVAITSPVQGEEFDDPLPKPVSVEIDASDIGWGVERVQLEINGTVQDVEDDTPPWAFDNVSFPRGQWTLVAIAEDYAGNVARSTPVGIGVGEPAPVPTPDDTGDGTTASDTGTGPTTTGDTHEPFDSTGAGASGNQAGCGCRTHGRAPGAAALLGLLALVSCPRSSARGSKVRESAG